MDPHQDRIARLEDPIEEVDEDAGEVVLLVDSLVIRYGAVHEVVDGPHERGRDGLYVGAYAVPCADRAEGPCLVIRDRIETLDQAAPNLAQVLFQRILARFASLDALSCENATNCRGKAPWLLT